MPDTATLSADAPARLADPTPVESQGPAFVVATEEQPLRLRSEPRESVPPHRNIIARLPIGHPVRAIDGVIENGFMEIETSLLGAHLHGFAAARFLRPVDEPTPIPIVGNVPARAPLLPPVSMPLRPGIARRSENASARSLNEDGQPGRRGSDAAALREALEGIIDWLVVDRASHKRYQPRRGLTFCNIYVHDFCHLAGVYLPRVWWDGRAISDMRDGRTIQPVLGETINEMTANALHFWLKRFGPDYGWRRTGTLTKLQDAANAGGVAVIVALRRDRSRSGHITVVAPEFGSARAKRAASGEVTAALESQAGVSNFRLGHNQTNWFRAAKFEDFGFWIHA